MKHSYGYVIDKPDERDFLYQVTKPLPEIELPESVDLRNLCSPVRDQGELGACTGFALATGLREFLQIKNTSSHTVVSPMYVYYKERLLMGTINQDSGSDLRTGMKVLNKLGVCTEKCYPYDIKNFAKRPGICANFEARSFKITNYHRLKSLHEMKECLANGLGFVAGFLVYDSFESQEVLETGFMPMPAASEILLGGHAVFVIGYQDDPKYSGGGYLIIKNSWGDWWGDNGYFYMPYEFAADNEKLIDAWVGTA